MSETREITDGKNINWDEFFCWERGSHCHGIECIQMEETSLDGRILRCKINGNVVCRGAKS